MPFTKRIANTSIKLNVGIIIYYIISSLRLLILNK